MRTISTPCLSITACLHSLVNNYFHKKNAGVDMGRRIKLFFFTLACMGMVSCSPMPVRQPPATSADTADFGAAQAYANKVRNAYLEHVDEQTRLQFELGNGLITLGALIAGAAYGDAHSDALVYPALIGGTAYALGQRSVSAQRDLIHLAGAEAIQCSIRTLRPLSIGTDETSELRKQLIGESGQPSPYVKAWAKLREESRKVAVLTAQLRGVTGEEQEKLQLLTYADSRLQAASTLLTSSSQTQASGIKLLHRANLAPGQLVDAVDAIVSDVDMARLETLPDLSSIGQVVGSLAKFADVYAPGVDLSSHLTGALASYAPDDAHAQSLAKGQKPQLFVRLNVELSNALNNLASAEAKLESLYLPIKAQVDAVTEATEGIELSDCKVEGGVATLGTDVTSLQAVKGKARIYRITIRGGVRPYVTRLAQSPVKGVEVKSPLPFERTVEVSIAEDWEGDPASVQIFDSSSPDPRVVSVPVIAAVVPPPVETSKSSSDNNNQTGIELLDALRSLKGVDLGNGSQLSVTSSCENSACKVACDPPLSVAMSIDELKDKILAQDIESGVRIGTLTGETDQEKMRAKFHLEPADPNKNTCKLPSVGGVAESLSKNPEEQTRRFLRPHHVGVIQYNLCFRDEDIDGDWGPKSQAAFMKWRKAGGNDSTGAMTADERDELLNGEELDCPAQDAKPDAG